MKHKSTYLCILALIAGLVVLMSGTSQSAPPSKATGGVLWMSTEAGEEIRNWAEFEAHAASNQHPAKGSLRYHNSNGLQLRMDVQCVTVVYDWAFFSGPIVSSSDTLLLNQWLLVVVYDGGSPGSKGDKIWGEVYSSDPGCQPLYTAGMSNVENGNLVIH